MTSLEQAARQALDAMEAALDESAASNHVSCRAILTAQIDTLRAALAKKQAEPVRQIAEALRQHGLTLVKTAGGYAVMKFGPVVAQQAEPVRMNNPTPPFPLFGSTTKKQAEPVVCPLGIELRGTQWCSAQICDACKARQQAEPVAYCYVRKNSSADALTFDPDPVDAIEGTVFPLYAHPPQQAEPVESSAERTLSLLGYTNEGGEYWKPPLGKPQQAEPVAMDKLIQIAWKMGFDAAKAEQAEPVIRAIEEGASFDVLEKLAADYRKGLK